MARRIWMWNPHVGGKRIPPQVRDRTEQRVRSHAVAHYAGRFERIGIRFRGALCYIDAYVSPEAPSRSLLRATGETRAKYVNRVRQIPTHLCRLRYFGDENGWSMAFFTYSNEQYSPCYFPDGSVHGTPEAAFDVGSGYLPPAEGKASRGGRGGRPTPICTKYL